MRNRHLLSVLFLFFACPLAAQDLPLRHLSREIDSNLWLKGNNPAGMTFGIPGRFSLAEANYAVRGGRLRNVYEPATQQDYSIHTLSFFRLNNICLYGEAGYGGNTGDRQQYNGMFRPSAPSVTIADTIAGRRKGETYRLTGAIAVPIAGGWSAGATIGYIAGNNAKDTDPRNQNNVNDLTLTPGLAFTTGKVGIGIHFSRQQIRETVSYTSFGTETKGGITFYPLWFFTSESFTDGTNANRNYRRTANTGALQFHYHGKQWEIFCQPSYTATQQEIWVNRATRQSAGETADHTYRLTGRIEYRSGRYIHRLTPEFCNTVAAVYDMQQRLDENHRIYETTLRLKRARTTTTNARLAYTLAPSDGQWQAVAALSYDHRDIRFSIFPTDFRQRISRLLFSAGYERQYALRRNILDGGLHLHYATGYGRQPDLSTLSPQSILRHHPQAMAAEYDYLTSATIGTSLHLGCTFPLPDSPVAFYLLAACRLDVAPSGFRRETGSIAAGIRF